MDGLQGGPVKYVLMICGEDGVKIPVDEDGTLECRTP
jgi:hypothetical protein